jgi:hypothetical protein
LSFGALGKSSLVLRGEMIGVVILDTRRMRSSVDRQAPVGSPFAWFTRETLVDGRRAEHSLIPLENSPLALQMSGDPRYSSYAVFSGQAGASRLPRVHSEEVMGSMTFGLQR